MVGHKLCTTELCEVRCEAIKNQQRKISFLFLGDKINVLLQNNETLYVSVQLVYQDCLKSFGAQLRAHHVFVRCYVEF